MSKHSAINKINNLYSHDVGELFCKEDIKKAFDDILKSLNFKKDNTEDSFKGLLQEMINTVNCYKGRLFEYKYEKIKEET